MYIYVYKIYIKIHTYIELCDTMKLQTEFYPEIWRVFIDCLKWALYDC